MNSRNGAFRSVSLADDHGAADFVSYFSPQGPGAIDKRL